MPAVGRWAGIVLALRQEAASATVLVPSGSCRHGGISGWFRLIRVQAREQSRHGRPQFWRRSTAAECRSACGLMFFRLRDWHFSAAMEMYFSTKRSMVVLTTPRGLFRTFCANQGEAAGGQGKTRLRSRVKPARPYIWRLIAFSRLT